MAIGAIGGCTDCATDALRPDKALRAGKEQPSPVEAANRLAEKSGEIDADSLRDQRVKPTETAAKSGPGRNLAQAAEVNRLRDGGGEARDSAGTAVEPARRDEPAQQNEPVGRSATDQAYQAVEASASEYPNRGGVLDFQI